MGFLIKIISLSRIPNEIQARQLLFSHRSGTLVLIYFRLSKVFICSRLPRYNTRWVDSESGALICSFHIEKSQFYMSRLHGQKRILSIPNQSKSLNIRLFPQSKQTNIFNMERARKHINWLNSFNLIFI